MLKYLFLTALTSYSVQFGETLPINHNIVISNIESIKSVEPLKCIDNTIKSINNDTLTNNTMYHNDNRHNYSLSTVSFLDPLFIGNSTNQTCQDCEILVHIIQHQITTANATLQDIIKLVQDVCQKLDSPAGKECLYIVDQIQQIIKWIVDGLSFQQICQKLGFCSFNKVSQNIIRNRRN